ncbi:hypothetical protein ACSBL2_21580 [Pedobacter sp. AW31-3R]|uniref:hypothetical protein n=1 Tax=Pedobacter sp. AW31-3R TaxID=3445781 RepID=UPI003F9FB986
MVKDTFDRLRIHSGAAVHPQKRISMKQKPQAFRKAGNRVCPFAYFLALLLTDIVFAAGLVFFFAIL